jgi:hypothetical protein
MLKAAIRKVLPAPWLSLLRDLRAKARARVYNRKKQKAFNRFVEYYGLVVRQGPFAGMKYLAAASGSELLPKIIGCYESELHPVIDEIIQKRYDRIIDIGCAEGYYAVGLAYRCPWAKVEAYDLDAEARSRCNEMAKMNNADSRIEVKSEFSVDSLHLEKDCSTLILCDCEGAEMQLFGESEVERWKYCDMLIELHDAVCPGTTAAIINNLSLSHDIRLIDSQDPRPEGIPSLWFLSNTFERRLAVSEERFPMQWAWITNRSLA